MATWCSPPGLHHLALLGLSPPGERRLWRGPVGAHWARSGPPEWHPCGVAPWCSVPTTCPGAARGVRRPSWLCFTCSTCSCLGSVAAVGPYSAGRVLRPAALARPAVLTSRGWRWRRWLVWLYRWFWRTMGVLRLAAPRTPGARPSCDLRLRAGLRCWLRACILCSHAWRDIRQRLRCPCLCCVLW